MLEVRKTHDGYIILRRNTDCHAHFKSRRSANLLMKMYHNQVLPCNPYMRKAMARVLTEEEFNALKGKHKEPYINHLKRA